MTHRDRRNWRIFLWVGVSSAIVSAWFGVAVAPVGAPLVQSLAIGVLTSVVIATPIMVFELWIVRGRATRGLRRLPLALYFGLSVAFYLTVIAGGIAFVRAVTGVDVVGESLFGQSFLFAVVMSVTGNLFFQMGGLLGFGTLKNLLTGRYVQPRREARTFLLIDMRDSTGLAERLGPVRFHELLNAFFRDVAEAAMECDAEIHKYVGDEAILTWAGERGLADGDCLACPFVVADAIAANSERYRRRFGAIPEFRAALHHGEIVAGEIGDIRREIAYVGDTLNVAARLLDAAKQMGRDILVSEDLLSRTQLPEGVKMEKLPLLSVRGREAPLAIAALAR